MKDFESFQVRSAFKSDNQPGTFKCKRRRCKTFPFISNIVKLSGPNRSAKVTEHFTCTSANVIYCITSTLCKKIYIDETGRKLANLFREHLQDVQKNDTYASKPVARHYNLPNYSHHNMTITPREHRKPQQITNKNSSFIWVHSIHTGSMNAAHCTNLFTNSCHHISTNGKAPPQFLYSI